MGTKIETGGTVESLSRPMTSEFVVRRFFSTSSDHELITYPSGVPSDQFMCWLPALLTQMTFLMVLLAEAVPSRLSVPASAMT